MRFDSHFVSCLGVVLLLSIMLAAVLRGGQVNQTSYFVIGFVLAWFATAVMERVRDTDYEQKNRHSRK